MDGRTWIAAGAIVGALGVTLGAFGAHGLDDYLTETGQAANYETAVRYQMYHALALVLVGVLAERRSQRWLTIAVWCFLFGVLGFSGVLYALVFSQVRVLVAIVPIGGTLLIIGWAALAASAFQAGLNDRDDR
jgi:uncharacterized membrane protein YgdD (TMEM256/DUF423 family)